MAPATTSAIPAVTTKAEESNEANPAANAQNEVHYVSLQMGPLKQSLVRMLNLLELFRE